MKIPVPFNLFANSEAQIDRVLKKYLIMLLYLMIKDKISFYT